MKNIERIRNMTSAALGDFLIEVTDGKFDFCSKEYFKPDKDGDLGCVRENCNCYDCMREWLERECDQ